MHRLRHAQQVCHKLEVDKDADRHAHMAAGSDPPGGAGPDVFDATYFRYVMLDVLSEVKTRVQEASCLHCAIEMSVTVGAFNENLGVGMVPGLAHDFHICHCSEKLQLHVKMRTTQTWLIASILLLLDGFGSSMGLGMCFIGFVVVLGCKRTDSRPRKSNLHPSLFIFIFM